MATPHISASPGDFAQTVLLPGDPLRARWIAERFLKSPKEVTNVRNVLGYTGIFADHPISVMGSGMGIPSASLYAYELIAEFGVQQLIRVGSCGAVADQVKLNDIVIGMGASTDSNCNRIRFGNYDLAALADFGLLEQAVAKAREKKIPLHVGNLFSSDFFYSPDDHFWPLMEKYGILGVEMEAAGLYGVATQLGARALAMCTVSDHLSRGQHLGPQQREQGFSQMITLALEAFAR